MNIRSIIDRIVSGSLVLQILFGLAAAVVLFLINAEAAGSMAFLGELFIAALMAVAPVLVLVLVASAIANRRVSHTSQMGPILILYLVGTISAALLAVTMSKLFPTELLLTVSEDREAPQGIGEVLNTMLRKLVDNPVNAIATGNFISLVIWGALLGVFLHHAADTTRTALHDLAEAITRIVRVVIRLAPIGIFGVVAAQLAKLHEEQVAFDEQVRMLTEQGQLEALAMLEAQSAGFEKLASYAQIVAVLVGSMLIMALVINPLIVWIKTRRNPYPIVLTALRESGVTAFFTRSSAANIPVNMALCERMDLEEDTYAVTIPLGATINMGGAAITITTLTLAAAHTLGIPVDFWSALLLSIVAALSACGASGVPGGSLLLIPLAAGLFNISNDVAMQVVAVGLAISVLQDSTETALNSSTDVVFTAAVASKE